ncbi:MAG: 3'(2'),5'-bisphosphate nucleotidase [Bacteroidetes bacterium]|nr:MAG: 3'(2'),5'-bisphosphate nucleotidase [Bacteroidota bacterium]
MKEKLSEIAILAGKVILDIYNTADFGIESKADNSPLTLADKAAHDVIVEGLKPFGFPILSEEGETISYSERKNWTKFWMVDPLDGTKEFIKKNGEFTVNIALIEDGKPTFGVIYVPVKDQLYIGGVSEAAVKITSDGSFKLKPSDAYGYTEISSKEKVRVVASRSHLNDETKDLLNSLSNPSIVSMGSSLKFMVIADGDADLYPRYAPTMEWDTAAAHGILNSLGYKVLQQGSLEELTYNKENLLNPYFICY